MHREACRRWRAANPEKSNKASRGWEAKNRDRALELHRQASRRYYEKYKEKCRNNAKQYAAELPEKRREKQRKALATDLNYKISQTLRSRLWHAIRNNQRKGSAVRDLGCSIDDLKIWLEQQFKPGMTWENHGEWHIDHIIPLSSVDLTDRKQLKKVCHWFNLQPLWAEENLKKSGKH